MVILSLGLHYPTQTMIEAEREAHEVKERTPEKLSGLWASAFFLPILGHRSMETEFG